VSQKRKLIELANQMKEIRLAAALNGASFDGLFEPTFIAVKDKVLCNTHGDGGDTAVTDFIRERTRLYRDSWIVGPLDVAIAELERLATEAA
jgi:hypothetical protein